MDIYTTKQDYIAQVITPALGDYAAEHDIDQIAYEMLIWHDEVESSGDINLGDSPLHLISAADARRLATTLAVNLKDAGVIPTFDTDKEN